MLIRTATIEDLQQIAEVEAACFPPAEAATEDEFVQRLEYYKEHFWLMFDGDRLIAFVDGMATDQKDLKRHPCMMKKAVGRWCLV